jgi:hypothetical protein
VISYVKKTLRGGGTAPSLLTSALGEDEGSISRPGRFTPGEIASGTHWIGGGMGHTVVLDVGKSKNS